MDTQTTAVKITAQEIMDAIAIVRKEQAANSVTIMDAIATVRSDVLAIQGTLHNDITMTRQLILDLAGMIQAQAQPAPMSGGSAPAAPAWCDIHQCEMQRHDKEGDVWYSHSAKRQDGSKYFCKGKKEKAR